MTKTTPQTPAPAAMTNAAALQRAKMISGNINGFLNTFPSKTSAAGKKLKEAAALMTEVVTALEKKK